MTADKKNAEGKQIRVLLVDDEEDLNQYLSKRLVLEGFHVETATSGKQAIGLAAGEEFDVAVVDLKMPGMDGLETQQRLKAIQPNLQTIVLTGHGSIDAALESGRQHAFRFLAKPADHAALLEAIREAHGRKRELVAEAFREEIEQVTTSGASPREIMARVEALRKKYGMPG